MAECFITPIGCLKEIGKSILTQFGNSILTQCLWDPAKRHINYWWCFDSNIQDLRDGIRDLGREAYDMNQKIEEARLRIEKLRPGVEDWSKAGTEKLAVASRILQGDNNPKAWNLISRYSMGKNAKKTAEEIAKLRNDGNFNTISDPAPPPAMGFTSHGSTMDFHSRKHIEEDIIESLRNNSASVIGICGMGGVGKTTMAQKIMERVKEENLFDEVVMVTLSQKVDMPEIQEEIAEWLKLKFDEKRMSTRAVKLRTRLMDTKRKIIIFDDVWERFKLEDLGVPRGFERCKIILTTRGLDVCKKMEAQKVIAMEILTKEEAWILFKDKVGDWVEGSTLNSMAKDVAAECKGLPIALITVGMGLQNEKRKFFWEKSLSQLRRSNPIDIPDVLVDVYKPLKLSYDYLDNDSERDVFLLCCLFQEDYDIPVEVLTRYSMGLQLFDDITNIEEVRNRTHSLAEKLKSRFLLIDGWDELHVKMHDVVRDVAIHIGSNEKKGFLKSLTSKKNSSDDNCNWMSVDISNERIEFPVGFRFPKLRLLMLLKSSSNEFFDISFEGMEDLNVLSFPRTSIGSLPPTLGLLKNLQTLCLVECEVENISVIGKLTSLKILSCYGCKNIMELPAGIGSLSGLRLLELYYCYLLQTIPFGVISSLHRLEELKMRGSFVRWEAEENGKERRNASLTELGSLSNLTYLEIEIEDCTLFGQEICLSMNLVKYYICSDYYFKEGDYEKVMILNLPSAVGNWIHLLARNAESLTLSGDGSNNINLAETENLRILQFSECSTVKKLVGTKDGIVFPLLQTLRLEELENLEEICHLNQNVSLCNLKSICISQCSNLRHLFSVSVVRTSLLQLEYFEIHSCAAMKQVFWNEIRNETDGCIEFPKLKKLRLVDLPNLKAFCRGLENIIIKFPNLTEMEIGGLSKLNSLSPLNSEIPHDENTCFHLFCNPKDVSFCNLKSIKISGCDNLRSLFSVATIRLLQLEVLDIASCAAMEQVVRSEIRDETDGCIEFPKLKKLRLNNLPNLTAFCRGLENIIIIKFPNLTQMEIGGLPKLNSLCPLNSETPHDENSCFHLFCNPKDVSFCNLKSIKISRCDNLRSLFSVATICLLQLEVLDIASCVAMEQLVRSEIRDERDGCIEFPKLKELRLYSLPKLTAFCRGLENIIIKFPNLTEMEIEGLPKLNSMFPLNSETPHDDNTCFHFGCNPKVETGPLKDLKINDMGDNIWNIWCHQIPNNVFNNLERLDISFMTDIRSLMSTSIAKNLVSLKYLIICECEEMVEVIERDDDDDKQVVDLFPTLKDLFIEFLPKLRRFWQWNHGLELPLLAKVEIYECPLMETFTLGSINTPNIKLICVNFGKIEDQKDLNDAIRHIWTESQDTSNAEEDGDEDANKDENNDESKDEYDNENVKKDEDDNERK